MRLAISNIAWPVEKDEDVAAMLQRLSVCEIEIAPTKVWPDLQEASPAEVGEYRKTWERRGMRIIAAQALLFGKPDLTIFLDDATRQRTVDYLESAIGLCADLGAESLVFGSPKNRRIEGLAADVVERIAIEFFGTLGDIAARQGTTIVMEANPRDYGADFVTQAAEAVALVEKVNHLGFRLHLDSACMTLSDDIVEDVASEGADWLHHFHVSEPQLAPVGSCDIDHERYAQALTAVGYDRWCSVEMKMVDPFTVEDLERAIQLAKSFYADEIKEQVPNASLS